MLCGIYINQEIRWLTEDLNFKCILFVDDLYVVTSRRQEFLNIIPELRHRLRQKDVNLSENKFYCQHYSKGVQVLRN